MKSLPIGSECFCIALEVIKSVSPTIVENRKIETQLERLLICGNCLTVISERIKAMPLMSICISIIAIKLNSFFKSTDGFLVASTVIQRNTFLFVGMSVVTIKCDSFINILKSVLILSAFTESHTPLVIYMRRV